LNPEAIKRLQEITNFDKVEVVKLYEIFLSVSEGGSLSMLTFYGLRNATFMIGFHLGTRMLNIEMFRKSLGKLEACGLQNLDDSPFVERLFILLDTNGDGVVDLHEFVTGLSLLCKGTIEQKLELSFKAYDLDGNGYISKDELASMFKSAWISAFQALCATYGNEELSKEDLNEFSEEMATQFSNNSFNTLDLNGDGQISFEEFKEFAMSEPKITATLNEFKKEVNITF